MAACGLVRLYDFEWKVSHGAACVIGEGVTIGQGAWVRAWCRRPAVRACNAIVEGNPAQSSGIS